MKVRLYYKLPKHRGFGRRLVKVARAIVAGHERAEGILGRPCPARARLKGDVLTLMVPPQLAEAADHWMRSAQTIWDVERDPSYVADHFPTINALTLIVRCGAILVPQDHPNGGYALRNGGPKSATSTVIPRAECRGLRIEPPNS